MASSSSSRVSKYDVFLSFRGVDTRFSIVSHLYEALARRGLVTFKDDKRLEIGDNISDELQRAIQGSDFVVVVLSENYATSRWCLMELQLIMELQRQKRLQVFPFFYGVKPSDVRHQQGSFYLGRYNHPKTADKVPNWRQALNQIADLSGVESGLCDEARQVWKIAEIISRRKLLMHSIDSSNIVGGDTHMEGLKSLLDMDSENEEVRMIGIWGMGGIGKTTIAKCLYGKISHQFEASYFTGDIKGIHRGDDLIHLQAKLLYSTLGEKICLWSVEAGHKEIKDRLGYKSVLLVLDGVDTVDQVHALAKETRWFGPRSRIIITTRDRGLLKSCGVKTIYEVKCLDDEDSLKMFKQIAFETGSPPPDDFEQLSIRASRLGHGLPSAIQANAFFLRGRDNSLEEWEEAVCGLESAPDEDTMKILKLSYEGLAKEHQEVFLPVACLFNGETYQRVISLLDGHGPHGHARRNLCIRVLAEKSLIKITTNGYVILHKLVEQMATEIMLDCRKLIGGNLQNIIYARFFGRGAEQTECISLHACELAHNYKFLMKTSIFERMHNLKFLKVYQHVDDRLSRLRVIPDDHDLDQPHPHLLRLFHWDGCISVEHIASQL
uniref:Putative disease resistance protein n=1 Tax=Noccaea caerulescens TaxID=107243 RepID=A0A1J3F844_NOCCA